MSERTAHELLTAIDGIGDDRADRLLEALGSGREVAVCACSAWSELAAVDGISEARARTLFDAMLEAEVYEDLRYERYADATPPGEADD